MSLERQLTEAAAQPKPSEPKVKDGDVRQIDLELLDPNPHQPRSKMDAGALRELADSIASKGQLQPILVRATTNGRFVIVAGHRRTAAFKLLRDGVEEAQRQRFERIDAKIRLALSESDLASMGYAENVAREGLTIVEEARALERMVDTGMAKTNEELAALVNQELPRIKRLRRIGRAPKWLKDAVDGGVLVVTGESAEGAEIRERRSLELMSALQVLVLFEHLQKINPKKAVERSEKFMERVLSQSWGFRRIEAAVKSVVEGKGGDEIGEEPPVDAVIPLFASTAKRFTIDVARLEGASPEQLEALDAAYRAVRGGGQR